MFGIEYKCVVGAGPARILILLLLLVHFLLFLDKLDEHLFVVLLDGGTGPTIPPRLRHSASYLMQYILLLV